MNKADKIRLAKAYEAGLVKRAATDFPCFMTVANPGYVTRWFHRIITEGCQRVMEGTTCRLMVFVPPQHGKSEIVSRNFPAWALGRDPSLKIVATSYSSDLAQRFSRSVQRIADSEIYHRIFPKTQIPSTGRGQKAGHVRNADFFETVGAGGFYKAVGVGGSLTGTPVDIAIIDDPVKDALEAYSETYRQRVWEWYNTVLATRLHNRSRQIFIMTRWHEDDLAGRIIAADTAGDWEVISIPAICEVDRDGGLSSRHVGDPLWPSRHSLEKLLKQREQSPREFAALYQQHPTIDGGNIIRREWFQTASRQTFNARRDGAPIVFFIDTAYTENTGNDPTGIIATCKVGGDLYITHAAKVYKRFPDLVRFLPQYAVANGYDSRSSIRIEPKANGISVIDQLKELTGLNVTATPAPKDSKETRLCAASPTVECGRVILVEGAWNEEFIDEVCGFPAKPHDEFVDVLCYAIDYHITGHARAIDTARLSRLV